MVSGYFLDPRNAWKWMPAAFPGWLATAMVRTPPAIWPGSAAAPHGTSAPGLLDGLAALARPKSIEEQLAELRRLSLIPDSLGGEANSQPQSAPSSWLVGAQWPDTSATVWPAAPATTSVAARDDADLTPEMHRGLLDAYFRYAARKSDPAEVPVNAPNAGIAGGLQLLPVMPRPTQPAPDGAVPLFMQSAMMPAPRSPFSWGASATAEAEDSPPVDEAAAAVAARRAAAMRLGQWRGRGTEEYQSPAPPAPQWPELLPLEPDRNHAFFSNREGFFVRDRTGNYYPATFLTYSDGTPVVDSVLAKGLSGHRPDQLALFSDTAGTIYNPNNLPDPGNGNPNNYLVVPDRDFVNILVSRGRMYGDLVRGAENQRQAGGDVTGAHAAAKAIVSGTFVPKAGYGDAQYQMGGTGWGLVGPVKDIVTVPTRDYVINPQLRRFGLPPIGLGLTASDHLIPAFTNAGNYGIGAFYQGAGLPIRDAVDLFGYANANFGAGLVNNRSEYPGGLSAWGYNALTQGYADTDLNTKLYSQFGTPAVAPNTSRTWSLMDSLGRFYTNQILSRPAY